LDAARATYDRVVVDTVLEFKLQLVNTRENFIRMGRIFGVQSKLKLELQQPRLIIAIKM
jgi:hypothetical protein